MNQLPSTPAPCALPAPGAFSGRPGAQRHGPGRSSHARCTARPLRLDSPEERALLDRSINAALERTNQKRTHARAGAPLRPPCAPYRR